MTIDKAHPITPYIIPGYWNGHSFGYGDITPDANPYGTRRAALTAGRCLALHVSTGRGALEGLKFDEGVPFNPEDYPAGTVVVAQMEDIHAHGPVVPVHPEEFEGVPVPARPSMHEVNDIADDQGRHYETFPVLGAIAATGFRRTPVVYGTLAHTIVRNEEGVSFPGISIIRSPIEVGRVIHPEANRVERVTGLRVYLPVKTQHSTFFNLGWLPGHTAPNEG